MKKYVVSIVTLSIIFSFAVMPSAFVSQSRVHAQTMSANSCYTFARSFGVGTRLSSAEASALQRVIINEGLWSSTSVVSSYDETLASAVVGLQEKYTTDILTPNGLSHGTGYFGNSTRAKVNSLYGCGASTQPSTSPISSGSNQGLALACPVGYTCRATNPVVSCPANYTCRTSPGTPQNGICPAGYICNPVTTPTTQPPAYTCPAGFICRPASSQNPTAPALSYISPTSAPLGGWITIYGSGFSSPSTAVIFYGNGTSQQVSPNSISSDGTTINVVVPSDLSAGTYRITVANLGNGLTSESGNGATLNICPIGYTCSTGQVTSTSPAMPQCPAGYSCWSTQGTPQSGNCPAGFTCSNTNTTATTPTAVCPSGFTCNTTNPVTTIAPGISTPTQPTPVAPKLTVISPNGGEVYYVGQPITVSFSTNISGPADVILMGYNGDSFTGKTYDFGSGTAPDNFSIVPAGSNQYTFTMNGYMLAQVGVLSGGGTFKIKVSQQGDNNRYNEGMSASKGNDVAQYIFPTI